MRPVEDCPRIFGLEVVRILRRCREFVLTISHVFRPGVSRINLAVQRESVGRFDLQAVVVRVECCLETADGAVTAKGPDFVEKNFGGSGCYQGRGRPSGVTCKYQTRRLARSSC